MGFWDCVKTSRHVLRGLCKSTKLTKGYLGGRLYAGKGRNQGGLERSKHTRMEMR